MRRYDPPRYTSDPRQLREVFSYFPSGVVAILAEIDGEPRGMVAAAFTVGVSIDPPLVSCAIQRTSTTWPVLRGAETIGVSVLGADQAELCRQLGGVDRENRFRGIELRNTGNSALLITGAPVWFECTLNDEFPAGDHTVALLEVRGLGANPDLSPLIFHGSSFRQLQLPAITPEGTP